MDPKSNQPKGSPYDLNAVAKVREDVQKPGNPAKKNSPYDLSAPRPNPTKKY